MAKRRESMHNVLKSLGLWDQVRKSQICDELLQVYRPFIEVTLADGLESCPEAIALRRNVERSMRFATFDCPILGTDYRIRDYFCFVAPALDFMERAAKRGLLGAPQPGRSMQALDELGSLDTFGRVIDELFRHVDEVLNRVGRIDKGVYFATLIPRQKPNCKPAERFVIHRESPRVRSFVKPDHDCGARRSRRAFLCGQPNRYRGIEWVHWPRQLVPNLDPNGPPLPVYVQSHALNKLYERALFIEDGEGLVHDYLWASLREPRITPDERTSRKFLVEYHLNCHHLGYLVACLIEEAILVETFLFLTMDGTPQDNELWKKLKLCRPDKEHLQLDRISTFIGSDLQFDEQIVGLLRECGCGHLFEVLKEPLKDGLASGYADEVRKHLRL